MTREEAKEILENWNLCHYTPSREAAEMVISALDPLEIISALRPISREQVEKVWRGEWVDKGWDGDFSWKIDGRGNCWKVIECSQCQCKVSAQTNFCPACGAPMTDEAVNTVMERLEALHGEKESD